MSFTAVRIPYRQTAAFSAIANDYVDQAAALRPFFGYAPTLAGAARMMEERAAFGGNRPLLVQALREQYGDLAADSPVQTQIEALLSPDTFTVTTAHQNNLFTGPLYFHYKIIHAIRLADDLKRAFPDKHFVPVYYMGSEDADFAELNHFRVQGENYQWLTRQKGAVGRMKLDKEITALIRKLEGQIGGLPSGAELAGRFREAYQEGRTVQEATFRFIHGLYARYGLLVLLPDAALLKQQMIPVFREELLAQTSVAIVEETGMALQEAGYKVQASARDINLFYLKDDIRNRIEKKDGAYRVVDTEIRFTEEEILRELETFPERFSPNVILRGLYEETILPNIVFIGGGGELAYWLQLKALFVHHKVPFPLLLLRNSCLLLENKWKEKISKTGFTAEDFFLPAEKLLNRLVEKETNHELTLNGQLAELELLYAALKKQATAVDPTLAANVEALRVKAAAGLTALEKKMLRAEKRKFTTQRRQVEAIKEHLFPGGGLQERTENFSYYYARWGAMLLDELYRHAPVFEQEFVILTGD